MKGLISKVVLLAVVCVSLGGLAAAQYGSVRGKVVDMQGNTIGGAQVTWKNQNNGRTYNLKTNKKGEFFSLGIDPGDYTVTVTQDGKVVDESKGVHVGLDELVYNIDLKQAQQQSIQQTAKKQGMSAEQVKEAQQKQQEELNKAQAFNANVKAVNDKLNAGAAMMKATPPDYKGALQNFQEAKDMMPDQDVVWYRLGNAYLQSARAQTDPNDKRQQYTEAYNDLQKAVDLKKAAQEKQGQAPDAAAAQKAKSDLATYYDNLGSAAARVGKTDEAVADFEQAAQLDPPSASQFYLHEGITLYNMAGDEDTRKKTIAAMDKVIAADPNKADAYYLKGATLFAMSTQKSDGTLSPPEGTTESLQKYLALDPTGGYAEQAKGMLQALNQKIESSYGTTKPSTKKK